MLVDIHGETRVPKLEIIIADDNAAFLHQMITLLGTEFDVVATAEDGRLALAKTLRHRPDVVVLDLEMPFLNGIEVTRELKKITPAPAVVMCSVESDEDIIEAARQAGALGYVFKPRMAQDFNGGCQMRGSRYPFCFLPLLTLRIRLTSVFRHVGRPKPAAAADAPILDVERRNRPVLELARQFNAFHTRRNKALY